LGDPRGGCYAGSCNFVPVSVTVGEKEVVFDSTTDRCGERDIPDNPAHVVRAEDGELVLFSLSDSPNNYVRRGPDFDSFVTDCDPALEEADLPTAQSYENNEWLWSPYREGTRWHVLIHNEFHGSVYNSITYSVSTDGARSFVKPGAPAHVVAPAPRMWTPDTFGAEGYFTPTNIVLGPDNYYYALVRYMRIQRAMGIDVRGVCAIRTRTLDDPTSWRAWDGSGYNMQLTSPYVAGGDVPVCEFVRLPAGASAHSLTYNTYLERYMAVDEHLIWEGEKSVCGFIFSTSVDLIHWSEVQLITPARIGCDTDDTTPGQLEPVPVQYPSIIDHEDSSINFERPGRTPYLYYTRHNGGLDRDLVRVPVKFTMDGALCEGIDCDDLNACTEDLCNGADGSCEHTPRECDDQNDCTIDTCNPTISCEHAAAPNGTLCAGELGTCQDGACAFPCTEQGIVDAIATGGGPHTFACAIPTRVVTTEEIVVDNDVILDGQGQLTVDGNQRHRVFSVATVTTAELIGFTVTGGATTGDGGGIRNSGTLALTNSAVTGNTALYGRGGGIWNAGTVRVSHSTVSGNEADSEGGGIFNQLAATLTLTNTSVSFNNAGTGGGGILNEGMLTIRRSTVAANTGATSGGGIENYSGLVDIESSTVSGNTATTGGGGAIENPFPAGTLSLTNTTVSGNSSIGRGAIENAGVAVVTSSTLSLNVTDGTVLWDDSGPVTFRNTIIEGVCTRLDPSAVDSLGGNIESPGNTCRLSHPTDLFFVPSVGLEPLEDNGGPTMTHALLPGSVAIDQIPEVACLDDEDLALAADQRGVARPQGLACDVGAFEYADCAGSPCDDGNECTVDHCDPRDASWCARTILPDATSCDLGGEDGVCVSGACVPNTCPMLFFIRASPTTIPPGQTSTMIETRAQDADGLPLPLVLSLSAPWGSFENSDNIQEPDNVVSQQSTYICDRPGPVEICVEATDGACVKRLCTDVMCPD